MMGGPTTGIVEDFRAIALGVVIITWPLIGFEPCKTMAESDGGRRATGQTTRGRNEAQRWQPTMPRGAMQNNSSHFFTSLI